MGSLIKRLGVPDGACFIGPDMLQQRLCRVVDDGDSFERGMVG